MRSCLISDSGGQIRIAGSAYTFMEITPKANLWLGQNGLGFNNLHGNFQLKPDTWYSLLMAVDEGGEFLSVIWDPQDTTHFFSYHETAG